MGPPTDPSSQPGGASDPGFSFVEAWAALVHALARHPESHPGVAGALSTALAARDAAAGDQPLRVVFARREVRVTGRTHALAPQAQARLLAERLESCGVAGALFEPGLRAPSLLSLSRQVLDAARRSALDPSFEHWVGEPVEHVHVLQRRFEGVFDGPLGETARRPLSLLRRVVASLPGDALDDPHSAAEHVLQLVREGGVPDGADDELIALEVELADLPSDPEPARALEPLESAAEPLGVYLHLLTTLDDEAEAVRLQASLARLVRESGAAGRAVLRRYLAPLADGAPEPAGERSRARLTGFLCDFDLLGLLAEHGAFGTQLAAERFPESFHIWLEGLDLAQADDHARLCALFAQVGARRVLHAGPLLFGEARLGDPERAAALLSRPHNALVPVARLLLARGVPALTTLVARFVRDLAPEVPEACLLGLLQDAELPSDVLAGLLDAPRTPGALATLRARVAESLCELIERPAADAAGVARRLSAAQHLADCACPQARARIEACLRTNARQPATAERDALMAALQRALAGGG